MIILAGKISPGAEIIDNLSSYVQNGGCLVTTAGNLGCIQALASLPLKKVAFAQEQAAAIGETEPFSILSFELPPDARVLASCGDVPAVVEVGVGKGRVVVFASEWATTDAASEIPRGSEVDKPLQKPYRMPNHVRAGLDGLLREQMLFEVGEGLSLITCRRAAGEFTLGVCNNGLEPRPFAITSHCGPIDSIQELPLDQSEKTAVGYHARGV